MILKAMSILKAILIENKNYAFFEYLERAFDSAYMCGQENKYFFHRESN
jgi:hypothetical protein